MNAEEVKQRKQVTKTEKSFLDELRKKYIAHCDHQDSAPDHNDVNPITTKRTLTDSADTDSPSDKLESIPNLSNKRIRTRTHHIGTSGFKICAPSHVHIESVYVHKKGKTQLSEYERENIAMRERIKVLEAIIDDRNELNQKLTVLRDNNFQTVDQEGLLAMKTIEDVKRELRKALGLDPSDKTFDKTKFKVQSDKSKTIGGAAKLIDWSRR